MSDRFLESPSGIRKPPAFRRLGITDPDLREAKIVYKEGCKTTRTEAIQYGIASTT